MSFFDYIFNRIILIRPSKLFSRHVKLFERGAFISVLVAKGFTNKVNVTHDERIRQK